MATTTTHGPTYDYRRELGDLYAAGDHPVMVEVPPISFLMIDGHGDPNASPGKEPIARPSAGRSRLTRWRWSPFAPPCPSGPAAPGNTTFPARPWARCCESSSDATPPIVGWILDERGSVRPHVNVFVNGERSREDAVVGAADVLQVLPSISGGS